MDSAIRLCHSAPPTCTAPGRLGAASARASRVDVGLSHGCLGVSHSCKRSHHMISRPLHVNCVLHRFSESDGSKNEEKSDTKIVRGMGAASLVLACVLGAFSLNGKMMNPKSNVAYAESTRDVPISEGERAPDSLEKMLCGKVPSSPPQYKSTRDITISEGKRALDSLEKMLSGKGPSSPPQYDKNRGPSQAEVEDLKLYAAGLSKPGKKLKGRALRILQSEYEKRKDTNPESAQYLEMAIIELHLLRGDYQKASDLLENFISTRLKENEGDEELEEVEELEELSDEEKTIEKLKIVRGPWYRAKVFLYKAILDTALNKTAAAKWLVAYKDTIN